MIEDVFQVLGLIDKISREEKKSMEEKGEIPEYSGEVAQVIDLIEKIAKETGRSTVDVIASLALMAAVVSILPSLLKKEASEGRKK